MTNRMFRIAALVITVLTVLNLLSLRLPGLPLGGSEGTQIAIVMLVTWIAVEATNLFRGR